VETHARKRARHKHTCTFANNLRLNGVEPTNNHAERSLRSASSTASSRSAVNPRKASAPSLSVSATCRLQRRSLFAYLSAGIRGDPIPQLA
jgi:hypothetical protein